MTEQQNDQPSFLDVARANILWSLTVAVLVGFIFGKWVFARPGRTELKVSGTVNLQGSGGRRLALSTGGANLRTSPFSLGGRRGASSS